jgi:hypothetical protein
MIVMLTEVAIRRRRHPVAWKLTSGLVVSKPGKDHFTHQNATAEMALLYRDIIIKAARSVGKGIIDVEGNESWERLKIHTVPLVR